MKTGYLSIGPIDLGRGFDDDIAFISLRVSKFQIVCEWEENWKELSFAWG
jgi:hypothetical protein